MGGGIYIESSTNIVINDVTAINCTTAIYANNTNLLQVNGLNTQGCTKGVVLDNCWDSDLKNLNIESAKNKLFLKENLLSQLVKFFMYKY